MKYSLVSLSIVAAATLCVHGATLPFLGGVNTAGYDFGVDCTLYDRYSATFKLTRCKKATGTVTGSDSTPPVSQFAHFASQGVNLFRIRKFSPLVYRLYLNVF